MANIEVTAEVAAEMHRLHGRIAELEAERDRYRARNETLRSALIKYGSHLPGCTYGIPQPRFCENPCTCGLRAAFDL
jgi:hypothetical protein